VPVTVSIAVFAALTLALVALWLTHILTDRIARNLCVGAGVISVVLALADRMVDATGLAALTALAVVCLLARRATHPAAVVITHVLLVLGCAALFVHVVPGFQNPVLVSNVVLSPEAQPYTKYLNFDKGIAALLLLALYAPERTASDRGSRPSEFLWRFAVLVGTMLALTIVVGFARWDPKLPAWWPAWLWSMVFLTALPEETLFRGCLQTWIANRLKASPHAALVSIVSAGVIFGVAHAGGGATYALLSSVAGIGYGWIYASTRSLALSTLAHVGLNTVHFLFFSYPALAVRSSIF
jgi:membrane protease YdiL (CAAX protease family)